MVLLLVLALLLLPPAAPLEVLWNAPYPQACRADPSAFARDASRWGLTVNAGAAANGAAIYTIGQGEGLYPRFGIDGAPINGGLPQLADVERHLAVWLRHVTLLLGPPGPELRGVVGLDWESWVPVWEQNVETYLGPTQGNGSLYRSRSEQRVRAAHPTWPAAKVTAAARAEFEAGAKELMLRTIEEGQRAWPNAAWGFYDYPSCFGSMTGDVGSQERQPDPGPTGGPWARVGARCTAAVAAANTERLAWLWSAVDVLLPSPYIVSTDPSFNAQWMRAILGESMWLRSLAAPARQRSGRPPTRIFSYAWAQYHHSLRDVPSRPQCGLKDDLDYNVPCLLRSEDYDAMLGIPAQLGIDGVVMWGAGADVANETRCEIFGGYVTSTLGPAVARWTRNRTAGRRLKADDDTALEQQRQPAPPPPCHRYIVRGAPDAHANGEYAVVTDAVGGNGAPLATPGLYKRCSTAAEAGTPHDCDKFLELYSMPAWPAAGTWRIRGWNAKVEYLAGKATEAGAEPPASGWLSPTSHEPVPLSVVCNRTLDDSFRPPKLVPVGKAELVWNQTADACPGSCGLPPVPNPCSWRNPGESPDSMPIAWHNPLTNESSLISATPWGTFANVGPSLHELPLRHDCSHSVYTPFNSSDPSLFADNQWMQSVRLYPNGEGYSLIHSEMHGDMSHPTDWNLCSFQRGFNGSGAAPHGECQYWTTGLGATQDGGSTWRLAEPPPKHMTFAPARRYVKDSANLGFGAIGGMLEHEGFIYGHVNEIAAGRSSATANASGVCAFRVPAAEISDPRAFRGWDGEGWGATWGDPYDSLYN